VEELDEPAWLPLPGSLAVFGVYATHPQPESTASQVHTGTQLHWLTLLHAQYVVATGSHEQATCRGDGVPSLDDCKSDGPVLVLAKNVSSPGRGNFSSPTTTKIFGSASSVSIDSS